MMPIHFYLASDSYGFLSNFARTHVTLGGVTWPTTEHYFQAQKFHDPAKQAAIRIAPTPGAAKQIAWSSPEAWRADWDDVRDVVMLDALRAKFGQHKEMRARLLATGDTPLVEHTANDHYWGDGGDGTGRNRLGQLLMQVRGELQEQTAAANRLIFDWLLGDNRIDLRRDPLLDE